MSKFNYTINLERDDYTVNVAPDNLYGCFEWVGGDNEDEEIAGGLWFSKETETPELTLMDFDGVYVLPKIVSTMLRDAGIQVGAEFDTDGE